MATIRKRNTKSKISYLIQVKVRDPLSKKIIVKSTTWHPSINMTKKQIEREVVIFADKFERETKITITGSESGIRDLNITLSEYCDKYVERRQSDLSLNTVNHYKLSIKLIKEYIGGIKLREITPCVIQNFYDKLDKLKKNIVYVKSKGNLEEIINNKGMTIKEIARMADLDDCTVTKAKQGKTCDFKTARLIAKSLDVDVNRIFNISVEEKPYAYETIHKYKRCLRAILSLAKKQRLIADNFASAEYINFPKRPETKIDFLDDVEAKIYFSALMNYDDIKAKTAVLTLLFTGFRRGELCGLNWEDIDFDNKTIAVNRSLSYISGFGIFLKEPKTRSSKREIAMPEILIKQLKEYKVWLNKEKIKFGDKWVEENAVFTRGCGGRVYPQTISNWVDKTLSLAGLSHHSVHSLRHTNITLQIMAGVPLTIVSGRAGHARTSTTADVYTHFVKSVDRSAAKALDNMFNN